MPSITGARVYRQTQDTVGTPVLAFLGTLLSSITPGWFAWETDVLGDIVAIGYGEAVHVFQLPDCFLEGAGGRAPR